MLSLVYHGQLPRISDSRYVLKKYSAFVTHFSQNLWSLYICSMYKPFPSSSSTNVHTQKSHEFKHKQITGCEFDGSEHVNGQALTNHLLP